MAIETKGCGAREDEALNDPRQRAADPAGGVQPSVIVDAQDVSKPAPIGPALSAGRRVRIADRDFSMMPEQRRVVVADEAPTCEFNDAGLTIMQYDVKYCVRSA